MYKIYATFNGRQDSHIVDSDEHLEHVKNAIIFLGGHVDGVLPL